MHSRHIVFVLVIVVGFVNPAVAGFQWTAASWTVTPLTSNTHSSGNPPSGGSAMVNIGAVNTDILTATLNATPGIGSIPSGPGGNSALASLTFSRTFMITEDIPGLPVSVMVWRNSSISTSFAPPSAGSSATHSFSSSGSPYGTSFNYNVLMTSGAPPQNFNDTLTLNLFAGSYTFNGVVQVSASRSSGNSPSGSNNFAIGLVPEPASLLPLAGLVFFVRRRIKSA